VAPIDQKAILHVWHHLRLRVFQTSRDTRIQSSAFITSVSSDVPRDKVSYTAMGLLTHLFRGTSELKIWWAHTNFRGFRDVLTKYFRTHISRFCYFLTLQRDIEKSGFDVFFALES